MSLSHDPIFQIYNLVEYMIFCYNKSDFRLYPLRES